MTSSTPAKSSVRPMSASTCMTVGAATCSMHTGSCRRLKWCSSGSSSRISTSPNRPAVPLSAENKRSLLVRALVRSHHAGMRERYYLLRLCGTNNCTSNPLTLVDHIVDYGWRGRLGSLLSRMPLNPRFYLRIRGLDADPSLRKLVRNEFTEYIEAPATRQRKRTYVRQRSQQRRDKPPAH